MKTTYKATFPDGTTAETKTLRKCSVAYKITTPEGSWTGFSINEKAAQQQFSSLRTCWVPRNDRSKAAEAVRRKNEAYRAASSIEIIPIAD